MKKWHIGICVLLVAALLSGCTMLTVDQMYRIPKRSEDYNHLQSAIDQAMSGLTYCAPLTGENQQPVQMVDLDGDGEDEYLLFAKSTEERPLRILVFRNVDGEYVHTDTLKSNGTAFDLVECVDLDGKPGLEIVVGRQVSDQVIRSLSVYTMTKDTVEQVITVNYTKFLSVDLDGNGVSELMVLRPGVTDTDNGIVELYTVKKGVVERTNEVSMSQPADKLKRIITGQLHNGGAAVYVASAVDENSLITDVYTLRESMLVNVSLSKESGTSVQTLRNFYVYADDIDNDGVVELPSLISTKPVSSYRNDEKYQLIRWYAMTPTGAEVDKMYTFHSFVDGWYIQLDSELAPRLTMANHGSDHEFYLWDAAYKATEKLMTIYVLSGQDADTKAELDDRFVLHRSDATVYAARLEPGAQEYGITQDSVIFSFRIIQQDWKTGET